MNNEHWVMQLLARFEAEHILLLHQSDSELAPSYLLEVDPEDWGRVAAQAAAFGCRWAGIWALEQQQEFHVHVCLMSQGQALVVRTKIPVASPVLASHTPYFPGADRMERHMQDMFGIALADHPDARRWSRHQAWDESQFPLRKAFPVAGERSELTPPDNSYHFIAAQGAGVYEIPVGPVHAGIIEPGHFRFQAVGETILNLEQHLGYVHKGIEKIAEGRTPESIARLAARVSGDSCVVHAWAACMAMERAAGVMPPARALALRAVMAERERVANHLGDIGAICNDVGFAFAFYQFGRLREDWQRASGAALGHRLMMDRIVPGGVAVDPDDAALGILRDTIAPLRREIHELLPILEDYPSLEDRLANTGVLTATTAARLGVTGYVGKASAQSADLRRDFPYAPYDRLQVEVPVFETGDVAARLQVRGEEILISLGLLEQLLQDIPDGPLLTAWKTPAAGAEGVGMVDGWRGEIMTYVRFEADNRIARLFPRDPSWFTWPALEHIVLNNIVPDFPVCNKSVNGSYSGQDL